MKIEVEIEKCDDCPKLKRFQGQLFSRESGTSEISAIWVCTCSGAQSVSIEGEDSRGLYKSDSELREILMKDCPYREIEKAREEIREPKEKSKKDSK